MPGSRPQVRDVSGAGVQRPYRAAALLVLAAWASAAPALPVGEGPGAPGAQVPRVLILSSFASDFEFFNDIGSTFRTQLSEAWPGPLDLYDVPLDLARYQDAEQQAPYVDYLAALFSARSPDLVVTLGSPASRFAQAFRERLFPGVPILHAALDSRLLDASKLAARDATVPVILDLDQPVETILELLPGTENVAIVLGSSPVERYWRRTLAAALEPYQGRLNLIWFDGLPMAEVRQRIAALPPRSAVYFAMMLIDGAGVPQAQHRSLTALREESNAPIFGLFDDQLGRGIVGGRLQPVTEIGHAVAEAAARLLRGERPAAVRVPPIEATTWTFDARELERWRIPASRLPEGSILINHPRSVWERYRWQILGGLALLGLQSMLIGLLVVLRARRRRAEEEVRALNSRLLSAYEQERGRLARELHDDVSQRLARLAIDGAQAERLGASDAGAATLRRMRAELARLGHDVHALSRRLHPSILDELGLAEAVRSEAERLERAGAMAVDLHLDDTPAEVPAETRLCLFRVAQEALRNIEQHARAARVEITLQPMRGGVELKVRDDGVGFDPGARRGRAGLGQVSMRERLNLVGGRLSIESAVGRGTTVRAWAPLSGSAA